MIDYQAKQIDGRIDGVTALPPENRVENRCPRQNSISSSLGNTIADLQKLTKQVKI